MPDTVKITGLREFQKALRELDAGLPKLIRLTLNEASGLVIDWARPRFPKRTGAARASLKARSSQRAARIAVGGRKAPYAPGLDFGGGRPQFPPYRRDGRYIYPGLDANRARVTEVMAAGLSRLAADAGLDVS